MFRVPNFADTLYREQAAPSSADFAILAAGYRRTGVVSGMVVSNQPTGLTLDVTAGVAFSNGRRIQLTNPTTVTLTAADGTNPRIDLVVARPNLAVTGSPAWTILAVTGEASIPTTTSDLDLQDGDVVLAAVLVLTNTVNLTSQHVLDKRLLIADNLIYRPTVWGAIGDGNPANAAVNTTAFLNCIGSIPASGGGGFYSLAAKGGVVQVDTGHYYLNGLIAIPVHVDFRGDSLVTTVFHANSADFQLQRGIPFETGYRGGYVGDFSIDAHRLATNPFTIGKLSEHTFKNIGVFAAAQDNITVFGCNNSNFENVNSQQASRRNVYLDYGAAGNAFIRGEFAQPGETAVYFGSFWGYPRQVSGVWTDTGTPCMNNQFNFCILEMGDEWSNTYDNTTYNANAATVQSVYHGAGNNNSFNFCDFAYGDPGMAKTSFSYIKQRQDRVTDTTDGGGILHPAMASQNVRVSNCFLQGVMNTDGTLYHTMYDGQGAVSVIFGGYNVFNSMLKLFVYGDSTVISPGQYNEQAANTILATNQDGSPGWPPSASNTWHNVRNLFRDAIIVIRKGGTGVSVSDTAFAVIDATNTWPRFLIRDAGQMIWGSGTANPASGNPIQLNRTSIAVGTPPGSSTPYTTLGNTLIQGGNPLWMQNGMVVGGQSATNPGNHVLKRFLFGFGHTADTVINASSSATFNIVLDMGEANLVHFGDPLFLGYALDAGGNIPDKLSVSARISTWDNVALTATVTIKVMNVSGSGSITMPACQWRVVVWVMNEAGLTFV